MHPDTVPLKGLWRSQQFSGERGDFFLRSLGEEFEAHVYREKTVGDTDARLFPDSGARKEHPIVRNFYQYSDSQKKSPSDTQDIRASKRRDVDG